MKILSAAQIREWDQFTIEQENISSLDLMERAANVCAQWLLANYANADFMIFSGPGNNGADGLAIARILFNAGCTVQVFVPDSPASYALNFQKNLARLKQLNIPAAVYHKKADFPAIAPNSIVIDAIFGTGLNKLPNAGIFSLIDHINNANARVVSIDIPSGMFCDKSSLNNSIVKADITLSFQIPKLCFLIAENLPYCGEIALLDIGLHKKYIESLETNIFLITQKLIRELFKPRPAWVHKYNVGHVLVYAGSKKMMGAALLCCKAAMRAGSGLVSLYNPLMDTTALNAYVPEVISSDEKDIESLLTRKAAICFGPGLTLDSSTAELLKVLLNTASVPMLIDASGLSVLKNIDGLMADRKTPIVLTPHAGEFDNLFGKHAGDFERMEGAIRYAKERSLYIVLKGPHTLVACPDGTAYFNNTGNSGMATAGSGDVLSGIITSLLGQGYGTKQACILGVHIHGMAGDHAASNISKEALIASDIIEQLGEVFKLLNEAATKNE